MRDGGGLGITFRERDSVSGLPRYLATGLLYVSPVIHETEIVLFFFAALLTGEKK
jgi:hypothetical protein